MREMEPWRPDDEMEGFDWFVLGAWLFVAACVAAAAWFIGGAIIRGIA